MSAAAAAPAAEKLAPINSSFINFAVSSPTALNFQRAIAATFFPAVIMSAGASLQQVRVVARAEKKAIDPRAFWRGTATQMKTFYPAMAGTLLPFLMLRGHEVRGEPSMWSGLFEGIKAAALVSLPAAGYAAYYRAMPPAPMVAGAAFAWVYNVNTRGFQYAHGPMLEWRGAEGKYHGAIGGVPVPSLPF